VEVPFKKPGSFQGASCAARGPRLSLASAYQEGYEVYARNEADDEPVAMEYSGRQSPPEFDHQRTHNPVVVWHSYRSSVPLIRA